MNFKRKSTIGWSIGNILLDLTGGVLNFGQMGVQSIDQRKLHLSFHDLYFIISVSSLNNFLLQVR